MMADDEATGPKVPPRKKQLPESWQVSKKRELPLEIVRPNDPLDFTPDDVPVRRRPAKE